MEKIVNKITNGISSDLPFHFGCIDNIFSEKIFNELSNTFPDSGNFGNQKDGGKIVFKSGVMYQSFIENNKAWKDTLDFFSSIQFRKDLMLSFVNKIKKYRPDLSDFQWAEILNSDESLSKNIKVAFEFSLQPSGSFLEPHTDNYEKLISFVFYFPPPNWREEYGGGTTFYKPKINILNRNLFNFYMPFSAMEKLKTIEYRNNRCIYFIKSANSWHSVEPSEAPIDFLRRAFMVNIELSHRVYPNAYEKLKFKFLRNILKLIG